MRAEREIVKTEYYKPYDDIVRLVTFGNYRVQATLLLERDFGQAAFLPSKAKMEIHLVRSGHESKTPRG